MALLYIKNLISTRQKAVSPEMGYHRIDASSSFDLEHASLPSPATSTTCGRDSLDEKGSYSTNAAFSLRNILSPRLLSDCTIGLSDGLTVPFALTAGLSALGDAKIVVYGGLAELVAGAISMGVAGYLGAKGEKEAQTATVSETKEMLHDDPQEALQQVRSSFENFQLPEELLNAITKHYTTVPESQFLSCLLRLRDADEESSQQHHPYLSGFTISISYLLGGFIPLLPYIFLSVVQTAFYVSIAITAVILFTFGTVKTIIVGGNGAAKCIKGGIEMLVLGGVAAAAAVLCVKALS